MQFEFVKAFCKLLQENKVNITIETAGTVKPNKFKELVNLTDFVYIDCKHYDAQKHLEGTGMSNEDILQNIKWLVSSNKEYCVRIPVVPGFNDKAADALNFCNLFNELGVCNIELLPFHQFGESKYQKAKIDYAYAGVKQLYKEDLAEYYKVFLNSKFNVLMK